jgi:hypothetical protein
MELPQEQRQENRRSPCALGATATTVSLLNVSPMDTGTALNFTRKRGDLNWEEEASANIGPDDEWRP